MSATEDIESDRFDEGLAGSNPERASVHNQRVILQAIRVNGALTVPELVQISGLTAPAVAGIIRRHLREGLLVEAGRVQGARGQPAMRVTINAAGSFSVGLNVDRDHMTLVALDFVGGVRKRISAEVAFAPPTLVREFVADGIAELRRLDDFALDRLAGIGLAIPDDLGSVDLPNRPSSYGQWSDTDVAELLRPVHPGPYHVANDATAAAIGELHFGHGMRNPSFFYLLLSAGMGGGLVVEGHPISGANGRSGEIGFLPIGDAGRTLQDVVSLSGLLESLNVAGVAIASAAGLEGVDAAGRAECSRWIERSAGLLVEPLMVLNAVLNPAALFLGGRLPESMLDSLAGALNERLGRRAAIIPAIAPVLRAALAADAAAMGAAVLPFSERFLPSRSAMLKPAQPASA